MTRQIFILFIIASFLKIIFGCASKNQDSLSNEEKVVKIIKTKAYTTRPDFDKLAIDRPTYDMGYDRTLGMDLSWGVQYFDKYGNILKWEKFKYDTTDDENIYKTIYYHYYNPQEKKLSLIKTDMGNWGSSEQKFIRNEDGRLVECITTTGSAMDEKILYSYNSSGKKIKKDVYEKEGKTESYEYVYDLPFKDSSNLVKEVCTNIKRNYKTETEKKWSSDGKIILERYKVISAGKLITDMTFNYSKHVGEIPLEETRIGFQTVIVGDPTVVRQKIVRELNNNQDIVKYKMEELDEKGKVIQPTILKEISNIAMYRGHELKYTYNDKNDWVELLLSAHNQKYIIVRDIKYLD